MIAPIRKRLSILGSENYLDFASIFITLFFFFLLFDSLKNNDVEKQEQIFEDGDSTISINRFRV